MEAEAAKMTAAATPDPAALAAGLAGDGLIAAHRGSSGGEGGQQELADRRTPGGGGFFSNPLAMLSPWRHDG